MQLYLWGIMDPLSIYKELVLVFSFWQVQDCYKVIVALKKEKKTCETSKFQFVLEDTAALQTWLCCFNNAYLLFRGIFVLQLLKEPEM